MARALRIPLLLLVSIGLSLLLCEGLVRLVLPQQLIVDRPDVWQPVEGPGWRKRPNVDTRINTGEGEVRLRTDARGYRVGERGDMAGDLEVLVLGDSFMEALQVEYEETLSGRLEAGLAHGTGRSVRVSNSGVSGWGPSHYLIEARRALAERNFDAILVAVYLGNDYETRRTESFAPRAFVADQHFRWPRSLAPAELVDAVLYPINNVLERSSHLFQLVKNANQGLLIELGLTARYRPAELTPSPAIDAAWQSTADTLAEIVALGGAHGVPVLVVVLPSHYQVVPEALALYTMGFDLDAHSLDPRLPNRLLDAALRERGVAFVDALPALEAAQRAGTAVYGSVDTHLNARGHEVVFEAIREPLLRAIAGGDGASVIAGARKETAPTGPAR